MRSIVRRSTKSCFTIISAPGRQWIILSRYTTAGEFTVNPNVAKVEDAVDPRRQGWSCTCLPRTLGNKGDAVSSAFPVGKKHGKLDIIIGSHHLWIPEISIIGNQIQAILAFKSLLPCFLCNVGVNYIGDIIWKTLRIQLFLFYYLYHYWSPME